VSHENSDALYYSISDKDKQSDNFNELLKSMVIGKWRQANDRNQIIIIKKDSMIDIYKHRRISADPIVFSFEDSAYKYYRGKDVFDFEKDSFQNGSYEHMIISSFKIKIIEQESHDTSINFITYVDSSSLELGYNAGLVSFEKIK
jgi:hypothetical protein